MRNELDPVSRQETNQMRLYKIGAEADAIEPICMVLEALDDMEIGNKPISGRNNLMRRLIDLSQGESVPIVMFNCIDFSWEETKDAYPKSILLDDTSTAICVFRLDVIEDIVTKLQRIGTPNPTIIIPDSEIFDERVFSYGQALGARIDVARTIKTSLTRQFAQSSDGQSISVAFWSEFCFRNGLLSPFEYTEINKRKIENDPQLMNRVIKQAKDSKDYFVKNGLDPFYVAYDIPNAEMLNRVTWYAAMYAGEGQALLESDAIVLNFEDKRVLSWFQKGADNQLPVITPSDPTEYYRWRNQMKEVVL